MRFIFFSLILLLFSNTSYAKTFMLENEPIFGASVFIQTLGNPANETIILVHGLGDEASTIWKGTIDALSEKYYIVTFDLPGFGKSSKENKLYSPTNYAKLIRYIANKYVKKPFHLIGHSMGGAIALKYTSLYAKDVSSLVLVDAAGILHKNAYSNFLVNNKIDDLFDGRFEKLKTVHFSNFIDKIVNKFDNSKIINLDTVLSTELLRGTILRGNPNIIAAVALVQENFNGIPQDIKTKTMLIWGEEDDIAPLKTGYVLNKLIPNSVLKVIPHSKHIPMITDKEKFLEQLFEHFSNQNIIAKINKKNIIEPYDINVTNEQIQIYTGNIKKITIKNSKNIIIKDAIIEELLITDSDVEIINSTFLHSNNNNVIFAKNSNLSIVASDLFGEIEADGSILNLAGVFMSAQNPIHSTNNSTVIFSLCTINDKLIHGNETIIKKGN